MNTAEAVKLLSSYLVNEGEFRIGLLEASGALFNSAVNYSAVEVPGRNDYLDLSFHVDMDESDQGASFFDVAKQQAEEAYADAVKGTTGNYLFVKTVIHPSELYVECVAKAYSVIGHSEAAVLQRKLYKNVSPALRHALDAIRIPHYIDEYDELTTLEGKMKNRLTSPNRVGRVKALAELVMDEGTNDAFTFAFDRYMLVEKLLPSKNHVGILNKLTNGDETCDALSESLSELGIEHEPEFGDWEEGNEKSTKYARDLGRELYAFLGDQIGPLTEFMLGVRGEDHLLGVNQMLLQFASYGSTARAMYSVYSQSPHLFTKYFDSLTASKTKAVVDHLKRVPAHLQKPRVNTQLFARGHTGLEPDLLSICNNSLAFEKYMSSGVIGDRMRMAQFIFDEEKMVDVTGPNLSAINSYFEKNPQAAEQMNVWAHVYAKAP